MIGFSIQVIYQPDEGDGKPCKGCGDPLIGTRYVMMIQMGPAEMGNITPMNYALCEPCYLKTEKDP